MSRIHEPRGGTADRRGAAAIVALLLLALAALVVGSMALASTQHSGVASRTASSVHAFFAAEAGRAMLISALGAQQVPSVPPPYAPDFDVTFTDMSVPPDTIEYLITARSGAATRVVRVTIEPY